VVRHRARAQDRMALASQRKAVAGQQGGVFDAETTPQSIAQKKSDAIVVTQDERPRETSLEAFAAQGLAMLRDLGLADDDARVNPNSGAIALGHPLGASGARLVMTAVNQRHRIRSRYALCAMCIGVGQGIAVIVERV
jgi:acetyl-CoA acetyltransferase